MKIFITGTDTHVGKTYISVGILKLFNQLGWSTLGIKPLASGCFQRNKKLYNFDALQLKKYSSIKLPYKKINPFAFQPAIAPHLAAQELNQSLTVTHVYEKCLTAFTYPSDLCVIEGAGGWYVPLNDKETMANFALSLHAPIILIISIRLGCLNHALLTHQAILKDGGKLLGWIANKMDPTLINAEENIAALKKCLSTPCLGVVDYKSRVEEKIEVENMITLFSP